VTRPTFGSQPPTDRRSTRRHPAPGQLALALWSAAERAAALHLVVMPSLLAAPAPEPVAVRKARAA